MEPRRFLSRQGLLGVVLICAASGVWASVASAPNTGGTPVFQTIAKETRYAFFVGKGAPVIQANAGQVPPHPGADRSSGGAKSSEGGEERPFPGALFATLLALIGVVTVARRGMSK